MLIDFDDGGHVEIRRATTPGKIYIIVAAKNADRTKTINSAEISEDDLINLLADVSFSIQKTKPTKTKKKRATKKVAKPKPKSKEEK